MKTVKVNLKVLIVSILSFLCFTLSAQSTAELRTYSHVVIGIANHFCGCCGSNEWEVYYDVNNDPYYAICGVCYGEEYLLDEDGNFIKKL